MLHEVVQSSSSSARSRNPGTKNSASTTSSTTTGLSGIFATEEGILGAIDTAECQGAWDQVLGLATTYLDRLAQSRATQRRAAADEQQLPGGGHSSPLDRAVVPIEASASTRILYRKARALYHLDQYGPCFSLLEDFCFRRDAENKTDFDLDLHLFFACEKLKRDEAAVAVAVFNKADAMAVSAGCGVSKKALAGLVRGLWALERGGRGADHPTTQVGTTAGVRTRYGVTARECWGELEKVDAALAARIATELGMVDDAIPSSEPSSSAGTTAGKISVGGTGASAAKQGSIHDLGGSGVSSAARSARGRSSAEVEQKIAEGHRLLAANDAQGAIGVLMPALMLCDKNRPAAGKGPPRENLMTGRVNRYLVLANAAAGRQKHAERHLREALLHDPMTRRLAKDADFRDRFERDDGFGVDGAARSRNQSTDATTQENEIDTEAAQLLPAWRRVLLSLVGDSMREIRARRRSGGKDKEDGTEATENLEPPAIATGERGGAPSRGLSSGHDDNVHGPSQQPTTLSSPAPKPVLSSPAPKPLPNLEAVDNVVIPPSAEKDLIGSATASACGDTQFSVAEILRRNAAPASSTISQPPAPPPQKARNENQQSSYPPTSSSTKSAATSSAAPFPRPVYQSPPAQREERLVDPDASPELSTIGGNHSGTDDWRKQLRVGDRVLVWSASLRTWIAASITKIDMAVGHVSVIYSDGSGKGKILELGSENLRPAPAVGRTVSVEEERFVEGHVVASQKVPDITPEGGSVAAML